MPAALPEKRITIMKTKSALCAVLLCIASAVALGQTVSVNYNKSQDFSQYHTYIWASNNANQIQNSILAQQAKSDIDNAMQGKGFQLVQESANPDNHPHGKRWHETADLL